MKKLIVFAVAFISFTGFTFSDNNYTGTTVKGQGVQETFKYFRIHRQAKNVVLNWGMGSVSGVTGFIIERSYDGDFYDVINQVPSTTELKYTWKDLGVFPGIIYYRIGCIMPDGRVAYSQIETIRIVSHG
jgi:hypothetical protein